NLRGLRHTEIRHFVVRDPDCLRHFDRRLHGQLRVIHDKKLRRRYGIFLHLWEMALGGLNYRVGSAAAAAAHGLWCGLGNRDERHHDRSDLGGVSDDDMLVALIDEPGSQRDEPGMRDKRDGACSRAALYGHWIRDGDGARGEQQGRLFDWEEGFAHVAEQAPQDRLIRHRLRDKQRPGHKPQARRRGSGMRPTQALTQLLAVGVDLRRCICQVSHMLVPGLKFSPLSLTTNRFPAGWPCKFDTARAASRLPDAFITSGNLLSDSCSGGEPRQQTEPDASLQLAFAQQL